MGKILVVAGLVIAALGTVIYLGWGQAIFGWMGKLPGDIRIENGGSRFYFPITTCLILSIVLTLIMKLIVALKGG